MYLIVKHHSLTHCCCIKAFCTIHHIATWCRRCSLAHILDQYTAYNKQIDQSCLSWQRCWSQIGDWVQLGFTVGCSMFHRPPSLYRMTLLKLESNTLIDDLVLHLTLLLLTIVYSYSCGILWTDYVYWGYFKFIWGIRKLAGEKTWNGVYFYISQGTLLLSWIFNSVAEYELNPI